MSLNRPHVPAIRDLASSRLHSKRYRSPITAPRYEVFFSRVDDDPLIRANKMQIEECFFPRWESLGVQLAWEAVKATDLL